MHTTHPLAHPTSSALPVPSATTSPTSSPVFRLRLIELDYYLCQPDDSLDPTHSLFTQLPLHHVPVLRIFGATPAGQHCCLHVHRYFPYFYVPMPDSVPQSEKEEKEFITRLGVSLETALREVEQKRKADRQQQQQQQPQQQQQQQQRWSRPPSDHLYAMTLHTAIDFYGYHPHPSRFIKLTFLTPTVVSLAASILLSGALLQNAFQPYEAHIPYALQFLVDASLSGMEFVDVSCLWFRQPVPQVQRTIGIAEITINSNGIYKQQADTTIKRGIIEYEEEEQEQEEPASPSPPSSSASVDSLTSVPLSQRVYLQSTVPASFFFSTSLPRLAHSELEADCAFDHLMNRGKHTVGKLSEAAVVDKENQQPTTADQDGKKAKEKLVRSLQMLWENEKARRLAYKQKRKHKQQHRKQQQQQPRPPTQDSDFVSSTQSSSLDFTQTTAPSPARVPLPPTELEIAYMNHLRAVARQQRPADSIQPTPKSSQVSVSADQAALPALERTTTTGTADLDRATTTGPAEEERRPGPSVPDTSHPPSATETQQRTELQEQDEEAEIDETEEVSNRRISLLESAMENAETQLIPDSQTRLPSVASTLRIPTLLPTSLPSASPVASPVDLNTTVNAEVDDELLMLSQQGYNQQEEEQRRAGIRTEEKKLYDEEEVEADGEEDPDAGVVVEDYLVEREEGGGIDIPPSPTITVRGQIHLDESEDEEDDWRDAADSTINSSSNMRIPQMDGSGHTPPSPPRQSRLSTHTVSNQHERRDDSPSSSTTKYAAIPLLSPSPPNENTAKIHAAAGDEDKADDDPTVNDDNDVLVIPATPPDIVRSRASVSSVASSSLLSPASASHSRTRAVHSGSSRKQQSKSKKSRTPSSAPSKSRNKGSGSGGRQRTLSSYPMGSLSAESKSSRSRRAGRAGTSNTQASSRQRGLLPLFNRINAAQAVEEIEEEAETQVVADEDEEDDDIEEIESTASNHRQQKKQISAADPYFDPVAAGLRVVSTLPDYSLHDHAIDTSEAQLVNDEELIEHDYDNDEEEHAADVHDSAEIAAAPLSCPAQADAEPEEEAVVSDVDDVDDVHAVKSERDLHPSPYIPSLSAAPEVEDTIDVIFGTQSSEEGAQQSRVKEEDEHALDFIPATPLSQLTQTSHAPPVRASVPVRLPLSAAIPSSQASQPLTGQSAMSASSSTDHTIPPTPEAEIRRRGSAAQTETYDAVQTQDGTETDRETEDVEDTEEWDEEEDVEEEAIVDAHYEVEVVEPIEEEKTPQALPPSSSLLSSMHPATPFCSATERMVIDLISPSPSPADLQSKPSSQPSGTTISAAREIRLISQLSQASILALPQENKDDSKTAYRNDQPSKSEQLPAVYNSASSTSSVSEAHQSSHSQELVRVEQEWKRLWRENVFDPQQPLQWLLCPLDMSASPPSYVHILCTPPPSTQLLHSTFHLYDLPDVIHRPAFFSNPAHYAAHMQSSSSLSFAVAHYQTMAAGGPNSASSSSSSSTLRSLVAPPDSLVDALPFFVPLHNTITHRYDLHPPDLQANTSSSRSSVDAPRPAPLPFICAAASSHLFLSNLPTSRVFEHVLQYLPPPPTPAAIRADIQQYQKSFPAQSRRQELLSQSSAEEESAASSSSAVVNVVNADADSAPLDLSPIEEEVNETEAEEEEAEEEPLRPASPKFEESFLSTLSYFLPASRRGRTAAKTDTPKRSSRKRSHSKRRRDEHSDPSVASSPSSSTHESSLRLQLTPPPVSHKKQKGSLYTLNSNLASPEKIKFPALAADKPLSSQLDGPTQQSVPSLPTYMPASPAAAISTLLDEDPQHLTMFSMEIHCCSRADLLPDPKLDAVHAIVFCARWDVHGHEQHRRELEGVLLCPRVQIPIGSSSASPALSPSMLTAACPPLPFPASMSVQLFPDESALFRGFLSVVRIIDPDILFSYEIQKAGLGYLSERGRVIGIHVCQGMSRIKPHQRREQWRKQWQERHNTTASEAAMMGEEEEVLRESAILVDDEATHGDATAPPPTSEQQANNLPSNDVIDHMTSSNPAERYIYNHGSGLSIAGRIILNLWRLMRDELKLNIYTFENVCAHVLGWRVPNFDYETRTRWWNTGMREWQRGSQQEQQQQHKTTATASTPHPLPNTGVVGCGEVGRCLEYYVFRCRTSLLLIDKLDLVGRTSELARVFGIKFYNVIDRGSQFRVESMVLRVAKAENYVLASLSPEQRSNQPAMEVIPLIMEPISRFYTSPVIVLDFQSLYPSMMIAYNICYSTCLGKLPPLQHQDPAGAAPDNTRAVQQQLGGLTVSQSSTVFHDLLSVSSDSLWISPCGTVFTKPSIRAGVLPRLLHEILSTRIMVKNTMKRSEVKANKPLLRILNARQFGLKLISNVTYGYTAAGFSGRMPCAEIADAIVSAARMTLEKAITIVESHPTWNAKVVYGDTDSLFVLVEGRSRSEAFRIGQDIAATVTRSNPKPVRLTMEKIFHPCMLVAKKRYVGMKYESITQSRGVLDAKGIEMVRRDGCSALVKIQEKVIRLLFTHKDVSLVRSYLEQQWYKIYTQHVALGEFIIAKEVRLGTYKVMPLAAIVATTSIKRDARTAPLYGERVEYVVCDGEVNTRLMDKACSPLEVLLYPYRYRISATYYIEKQLIPPLTRLMDLIGVSVQSWYAAWPRPRRRLYCPPPPPPAPAASSSTSTSTSNSNDWSAAMAWGAGMRSVVGLGGKKRTIDHYYQSQHCPQCDTITTTGYCAQCRAQPSMLHLSCILRLSDVQRKYQQLLQICHTCIGGGYKGVAPALSPSPLYPLDVECTSRDCPVLFARFSMQEQVRDALHRLKLLEDI